MAANTMTRRGDLTQGAIISKIIAYTIPLLLGDLLQQFYAITDSVIVGNFVGKEALAGVGGSAAMVCSLVLGFFTGLSSGATVVISHGFGAEDKEKLTRAVHTAIAFSILAGAFITALGIWLAVQAFAGIGL